MRKMLFSSTFCCGDAVTICWRSVLWCPVTNRSPSSSL